MNAYDETRHAYKQSAEALTQYYKESGTRRRHMDEVISLIGSEPVVLELGCGSGRDAAYLTSQSTDYVGIDYSKPLLDIAQKQAPQGRFILGDIVTTDYPTKRNAVFAFASILHIQPHDIAQLMRKVSNCLEPGGVFHISTKLGNGTTVKKDQFGTRTYYLYQPSELQEKASPYFDVISSGIEQAKGSDWVELTLRQR